jgi:hypothetical protein
MAVSDAPAPPRWGRILGVLAAIFLVLEAGAQGYYFRWTGRPYGSVFLYLWSPYGLVRNNPNLTGNFSISPQGFREVRAYDRVKPPNTFRVMLMGGSVLYSGSTPVNSLGYVQSDKTISQYLTARLRADPAFRGVNVEVINTAVNYNRITEVSTAYLGDYIKWNPDVLVVFGSVNNFPKALRQGEWEEGQTALQVDHPWRLEFDRLVNEWSVASTIEAAFRQAVNASAALAFFHKAMERSIIENAPFERFAVGEARRLAPPRPLAPEADEDSYLNLYGSYADAMIAATRRANTDIAFVWEYHLGDLGGRKPMSAEERRLYANVKRDADDTAYDQRTHAKWAAMLGREGVPTVDPLQAICSTTGTVYNDYVHYTANGNDVVAGALYQQLRAAMVRKLASRAPSGGGR